MIAFRELEIDGRPGLTYDCGCPCVPTAVPAVDGTPGSEHCCCGKVHFAGAGARAALDAYLAERRERRRREPDYDVESGTAMLAGAPVEVAWAFPRR
jgi:hypothetical protein